MKHNVPHSFHIPVMGLGFTIDTPLKVARYGITSVVSIIEDNLIEQMREFHCEQAHLPYTPIAKTETDHRARRITAYLDLMHDILDRQMADLRAQPFEPGSDIVKYFELLEDNSFLKTIYESMIVTKEGPAKEALRAELRRRLVAGAIEVNIMTKCDRQNPSGGDQIAVPENSDALSALRGFAKSKLNSSVVFSAGLNPRLYGYCEQFDDFFPDSNGEQKKKIIIKVSDYRSALVQGKFFAKKGLWISEFRIESGLNCGGHAFPTQGILMGPILEEFKTKRKELYDELYLLCIESLERKGKRLFKSPPSQKITAQGGVGTSEEHYFLLRQYDLDSVGWGSPFLLVPEATEVDEQTLLALSTASRSDYYLSYASPLGVAFNNFKKSSSEKQRKQRIEKGRPGSPCYKKFLAFNTEFTEETICTASRQYQNLKIAQLMNSDQAIGTIRKEVLDVVEKDCLCEGLAAAPLIKNKILRPKQLQAVAICPGPNLAYFSGVFTLRDMVDHIYGRKNLLNKVPRPHMFVNELKMYADYLKNEIRKEMEKGTSVSKYCSDFKNNLIEGISYYETLFAEMKNVSQDHLSYNLKFLCEIKRWIHLLSTPPVIKV